MQKLASEFERTTIITKQERTILGFLKNFIINPQTGRAIGISFQNPRGKNQIMVANTSDIVGLGTNFLMLESADSASSPSEIIRIKEILDMDIELINSKVVDEDERNLGKLRDYSINLKAMQLERLYVAPSSLVKLFASDLIISAKNIIKIEKGKIIVRSGSVKPKKKAANVIRAEKSVRAKSPTA